MNIETILELSDWDEIVNALEKANAIDYNPQAFQDAYDGKHDILKRNDKIKTDEDDRPIGVINVAKMTLKYQKKIVESAVAFLFGVPVSLSKTTEGGDDAFTYLKDNLKNLKFGAKNRFLSRKLFTQKRATKLYFIKNPDDAEKRKIASMVLSIENGSFYPNFNDTGDMDALLRVYETQMIIEGNIKDVPVFELYTVENIVKGTKPNKEWELKSEKNMYEKIPGVYYEQPEAEWEGEQSLIDRQELSLSELIDTNQYFSAPIPKVYGKISSLPEKQDQGKVIECEFVQNPQTGQYEKSDVQYLTWDQRPESLQMQFDLIEKYIYSFSQTADISFSNMLKNKPGNISGVSLKILLLDPILKSMNKQEIFEENLQRELSVIKSILATLETKYKNDFDEMQIEIGFNSILPDNLTEVVDYLTAATGGEAIISQETAVQKNPLVVDKEAEIKKINAAKGAELGSLNL